MTPVPDGRSAGCSRTVSGPGSACPDQCGDPMESAIVFHGDIWIDHTDGAGILPEPQSFPWIARLIECPLRFTVAIQTLPGHVQRIHESEHAAFGRGFTDRFLAWIVRSRKHFQRRSFDRIRSICGISRSQGRLLQPDARPLRETAGHARTKHRGNQLRLDGRLVDFRLSILHDLLAHGRASP